MYGGVLVAGLLDVLELEAVVEVVQNRAESQHRWGRSRTSVNRDGGGSGWLARQSTINEMGLPHCLDVWAWAQSSVRWWCFEIEVDGSPVNRATRTGGLASSAWHIDQMGPPYCSDVWASAQSSVQWWLSIRSAGRACSCGFLVDNCLQIRQTRQTRRALGLASSAQHHQ